MATITVSLVIPCPLTTQEALYSFSSFPSCTKTNNSFVALQDTNTTCTLNPAYTWPVSNDPVSTTLTLTNRSPSTSVRQILHSNLSYLATSPAAQNPSHDFKAFTYGTRTTCSPTSRACNLANNGNVTFNCNNGCFAAQGDQMNKAGFVIQAFKYSNLSDWTDSQQEYGVPNPLYVAGATINSIAPNSPMRADAELVTTRDIVCAVFQCQVTILDLEYTSINGDVQVISEEISNISATNMFASGITGTPFGQDFMKANIGAASLIADNADDFAGRFAIELSNIVLSSGAGSIQHVPVEIAQVRENILVARMPKVPFYLLISSNLVFVALGVILTVIAISTPRDARQAQYHLSTAGLVANVFDRGNARNQVTAVQDLFVEHRKPASAVKIGIDRTSKGGFELTPLYFAQ